MNLHLPSLSLRSHNLGYWLLITLIIGALGYSAGVGYFTYAGKQVVTLPGPAGSTTPSSSSDSSATIIPELKLNNSHQRLGNIIIVDPDKIGRDNPFNQP